MDTATAREGPASAGHKSLVAVLCVFSSPRVSSTNKSICISGVGGVCWNKGQHHPLLPAVPTPSTRLQLVTSVQHGDVRLKARATRDKCRPDGSGSIAHRGIIHPRAGAEVGQIWEKDLLFVSGHESCELLMILTISFAGRTNGLTHCVAFHLCIVSCGR